MEDVLAIRDEYRLQEWSQIIQAGQNSGLSKREFCRQNRPTKSHSEGSEKGHVLSAKPLKILYFSAPLCYNKRHKGR